MRRVFSLLFIPALPILLLAPVQAEDSPTVQEFHDLRQAVQQQSKQIEFLAEQVNRLTKALESGRPVAPPPPPAATEPPKEEFAIPTEGTKPEAAPKAEAVSGPKHTVAKGETLTSIAKQYNVTIAELKTANKIENERKIQIGQILSVPTPKTPEPTDKKDKP